MLDTASTVFDITDEIATTTTEGLVAESELVVGSDTETAETRETDDPIDVVWDFTNTDVRLTDTGDAGETATTDIDEETLQDIDDSSTDTQAQDGGGSNSDIPDCIIWNIDGAEVLTMAGESSPGIDDLVPADDGNDLLVRDADALIEAAEPVVVDDFFLG